MRTKTKFFEEDDDGLEDLQDRINKFLSQGHIIYEDLKTWTESDYLVAVLVYREKD